MGKFAAIYDLPAGEQLLVCVVHHRGNEPYYQVSTEINGVQTSLNMPCQMDNVKFENTHLTHQAMKDFAVAYLVEMPMENVIALRKMMVAELLSESPIIEMPVKENNTDAN